MIRLQRIGSETRGHQGHWSRWTSNVELTDDEWADIKHRMQYVYRGALRKNLANIGFFLDDNDDIAGLSPRFLDNVDFSGLAPGAEDDPEIARHLARIRELKERHDNGMATTPDDGAAVAAEPAIATEGEGGGGDDDHASAAPPPAERAASSSLTWVAAPQPLVLDAAELARVRADIVDYLEDPATGALWRLSEDSGQTFQRSALAPQMSVERLRIAERDRIATAALFGRLHVAQGQQQGKIGCWFW